MALLLHCLPVFLIQLNQDCTRKPGHIPVAESATYLASIQSENHKHYTNVNPSNCGTSYLLCGHNLPLSKVQEGMGNTSQSS